MSDQPSQELYNIRHSAAHVLAQAVKELYPDTKVTIGPVTETGFFYDFLPTKNFKEEDLPLIEKKMRQLVKKNYKIEGDQVPKDEARKLYHDNEFKCEIIDQVEGDTVGIYYQGDFFDLCKGGHVVSIGKIKHFKLMSISGSYWRADRDGIALQRITGVAFETKEELEEHLQFIKDAKTYDHRRLGKELDLFSFHDEAPGMPFFHAKGMIVYNGLIDYLRNLLRKDYQEVRTPIILDESLWKRSGHYDFYKNNMYFTQIDDAVSCVKPMNCPGAVLLYKVRPRSYRELPLRLAEFGIDHRQELSGVLHGLFRVRAFTMDDAHVFCTIDQIEDEVGKMLELCEKVYKTFGFESISMAISTKPEKAMGSDADWETAISALTDAMSKRGIDFAIQEGEGAFYGPKIEVVIKDNMKREWQCGTIQIDFNMPINFELDYIASDQSKQRPVMIHRAIYGSLERFYGILLEHFKGRLPFWLAPVQARVLTITSNQDAYADDVLGKLKAHGLRAEADYSGDKISAQIRRAQMEKVPWMIVLGDKELEKGTVTLRDLDGKQEFDLSVEALLQRADELSV